jgi:hypothetical protein
MIRFRVTYDRGVDLQRALTKELGRGALLVKVAPPGELQFRDPVALEIVGPSGASMQVDSEVMSLLPGVGVAVAFPSGRVTEVRALLGSAPDAPNARDELHEVVGPSEKAPARVRGRRRAPRIRSSSRSTARATSGRRSSGTKTARSTPTCSRTPTSRSTR